MTQPHGKTLRILHVIASMGAEVGGPPAVCAGLTRSLADRGHAVTIATLDWPNSTPVPVAPNVSLRTFPFLPRNARYAKSPVLALWLDTNIQNFDIVHLHSIWQFPTFAAARACWEYNVPYVDLLNGMLDRYSVAQRSSFIKRLYWFWREGKIAKRSKGIHFLNRAEIRRAVPWVKNIPKFILGNGISTEELNNFPPRGLFRAAHPEIADRPLVLFLSRIHPKKGLERLIPAWKSFAQQMPDARFVIAGTGDTQHLAHIDNLIKENNLSEKILRVGQLVGEKKWQALIDADLFVLPSHQEGFSMAITEAMAAGCPPIITQECNFDEVEEQKTGIIIKDGNMQSFVDGCISLLNNAAQRAAFSEAGKSLVRTRYTWEKIAQDLESIYNAILSGKKLSPDAAETWRT